MLTNYLTVSAIVFSLGAAGFIARRNMIVMFLCAEMMLQGVALNLVAFGHAWANWHGPILALFVIAVAAAEAGVALALVVSLYRRTGSLDVSLWQELREPGLPAVEEEGEEQVEPAPPELRWPKLTPAGVEPQPSGEQMEEEAAHV